MSRSNPNYTDRGLSDPMGPRLRALVEVHLSEDGRHYGIDDRKLRFDWSESCIEGHHTTYLDGSLENFSSILVFDSDGRFLAEGWMEFIHEGDFFLVYWDYLEVWLGNALIRSKAEPGIPDHIWQQIPPEIRKNYENDRYFGG